MANGTAKVYVNLLCHFGGVSVRMRIFRYKYIKVYLTGDAESGFMSQAVHGFENPMRCGGVWYNEVIAKEF